MIAGRLLIDSPDDMTCGVPIRLAKWKLCYHPGYECGRHVQSNNHVKQVKNQKANLKHMKMTHTLETSDHANKPSQVYERTKHEK